MFVGANVELIVGARDASSTCAITDMLQQGSVHQTTLLLQRETLKLTGPGL